MQKDRAGSSSAAAETSMVRIQTCDEAVSQRSLQTHVKQTACIKPKMTGETNAGDKLSVINQSIIIFLQQPPKLCNKTHYSEKKINRTVLIIMDTCM